MLYLVTAVYYTQPFDRSVYRHLDVATYSRGISNKEGDLRNNLWSKDLFVRDERRVAVVGSSFSAGLGRLAVSLTRGEPAFVVSESLAIGGNGLLNGARVAATLSAAKQANVIVLAVSPLNFGNTLYTGAFAGQCMESALPGISDTDNIRLGGPHATCLPQEPKFDAYLEVFEGDRKGKLFQFFNFFRNVALAPVADRHGFTPMSLDDDEIMREMDDIGKSMAAKRLSRLAVRDQENGSDEAFNWRQRGITESLQPGGDGYRLMAHLKQLADRNGVKLLVYETPTPTHAEAPTIFPAGFFEQYQRVLKKTLRELEIPYLDLSRFAPWTHDAMIDFVHPQQDVRQYIHKIVLAWIYAPDALRRTGLLQDTQLGGIKLAKEGHR